MWGQGIWEPRAFWDACDELGVLLYTDSQIEPIYGNDQEHAELDYQIKRLSHHPSIAMCVWCHPATTPPPAVVRHAQWPSVAEAWQRSAPWRGWRTRSVAGGVLTTAPGVRMC